MRYDKEAIIAETDAVVSGSAVRLLEVSSALEPYVAQALLRLSYLYSHVQFAFEHGYICIVSAREVDCCLLKSEIAHALYREKIFTETLPMRRAIYDRIFG